MDLFLAIELSEEHNPRQRFSETLRTDRHSASRMRQCGPRGGGEMQNHQNDRCARNDLSVFEVRISERMPDFITVHTFGGRGSPSF
jgi:hypothetical protein